jgi:hypothetical protein
VEKVLDEPGVDFVQPDLEHVGAPILTISRLPRG